MFEEMMKLCSLLQLVRLVVKQEIGKGLFYTTTFPTISFKQTKEGTIYIYKWKFNQTLLKKVIKSKQRGESVGSIMRR